MVKAMRPASTVPELHLFSADSYIVQNVAPQASFGYASKDKISLSYSLTQSGQWPPAQAIPTPPIEDLRLEISQRKQFQ